ncbi:MAG: hypothetical protein QM831_00310 [Kofleriaceae bacterium]
MTLPSDDAVERVVASLRRKFPDAGADDIAVIARCNAIQLAQAIEAIESASTLAEFRSRVGDSFG